MNDLEEKKKELESLKYKYFMLQMCDHWDSSDYKYSNELHQRIMKLENELGEVS